MFFRRYARGYAETIRNRYDIEPDLKHCNKKQEPEASVTDIRLVDSILP